MDQGLRINRKPCPKETASIFSVLTFFYTLKIFIKGFKKELDEDDIYAVMKKLKSKKLSDRLEKQWIKTREQHKKFTFYRVLWFCYAKRFFAYGCIEFVLSTVVHYSLSNTTGRLVTYFSEGQTEITTPEAYLYAGGMVTVILLDSFLYNNYYLLMLELATTIRTAFCSMLYRKCLKLSPEGLSKFDTGKLVTLMTKDAQVIDTFIINGTDTWNALLQVIILTTFMYIRIGFAAIVGVGSFLLIIPLEIYLSKKAGVIRYESNKKSDVRLQRMQEALSVIKIVKMYTWESFFINKISEARKSEIFKLRQKNFLKAATLCISFMASYISFYILLIIYTKYESDVTGENIFYTIGLYQNLRKYIAQALPFGIMYLAELGASITRIEDLMDADELDSPKVLRQNTENPKIVFKSVESKINGKIIIEDISCTITKGLNIVTGPLGCGKSSFLKVIIQDYPVTKGTLEVRGSLSYASQDPWLFPASIKDNILFGEKFSEERYRKVLDICALNYDLELMLRGDRTIVEDRGMNLSKGQQARINLARAIYRDSDIYLLDDCLAALDQAVQEHILKRCIVQFLTDKICLCVTHCKESFEMADQILFMKNGSIETISSPQPLKDAVLSEIIHQDLAFKTSENNFKNDDAEENLADEFTKLTKKDIEVPDRVYYEAKKVGKVEFGVYKKFLSYGGGIAIFIFIVGLYLGDQFSLNYLDKILSGWVNTLSNLTILQDKNHTNSSEYHNILDESSSYLDQYFIMLVVAHIAILIRSIVFILFISRISINIHNDTIAKVLNATMEFFDNTFIGNILNRFSRDMSIIDEDLPLVVGECIMAFCNAIVIFGLVAAVNTIYIIPSVFICILLLLVRYVYVRTGRSLRRLDSATRSPVIGHLNATIEGLTTIRAHGKQKIVKEEFDRHQDLYNSAYHLSCITGKAFAAGLHTLTLIYITFVIVHLIIFHDTLPGDAGLALTQANNLTGLLQWGLRQWALLENQMTAVERVLEYTNSEQEATSGEKYEDWPKEASIIYKDVSLTYKKTGERTLKNVNICIPPRSKIGIVGRTGAGKSSIISTLFRLYKTSGKIFIDDKDMNSLDVRFLRSHISLIPQDPILFRGTLRENIDPYNLYTDENIWKVLKTIKMDDVVTNLNYEITNNETQFSAGQRQLFCLARALVQKNKIIVLDEATANLDPETDIVMQNVIEEQFSACTVLSIAHKLDVIQNSDKIMVLDKGEVVEFDTPSVLMRVKDSLYCNMIKK